MRDYISYFIVGVIGVKAGIMLGNAALSKLPNILYAISLRQLQPDIALLLHHAQALLSYSLLISRFPELQP
jgi:hypothetical protein